MNDAIGADGSPARWVVAELDGRGRIDDHAAMCLRQAIDGHRMRAGRIVVVDLRDLTGIDGRGLALLTQARADCTARRVRLRLLMCTPEPRSPSCPRRQRGGAPRRIGTPLSLGASAPARAA